MRVLSLLQYVCADVMMLISNASGVEPDGAQEPEAEDEEQEQGAEEKEDGDEEAREDEGHDMPKGQNAEEQQHQENPEPEERCLKIHNLLHVGLPRCLFPMFLQQLSQEPETKKKHHEDGPLWNAMQTFIRPACFPLWILSS